MQGSCFEFTFKRVLLHIHECVYLIKPPCSLPLYDQLVSAAEKKAERIFFAFFSSTFPETSSRVSSTLRGSFDSSFGRKRWNTGKDGQKDLPHQFTLWWQTPPHSTKLFTYFSTYTTVQRLATSPDLEHTRVISSASAFDLGVAVMSWWEFTIQRTPAAHGTRQIRSVTKAPTRSCTRLFRRTPISTTQATHTEHHSTLELRPPT